MTGIFLFVTAFILLMLGIPVAFAFGGSAIIAAFLDPNVGLDVFGLLPYSLFLFLWDLFWKKAKLLKTCLKV